MKEFIAQLKQKPEHVRRRIAVGTSVGVTAFVSVVWLGTMATTGAFALAPKNNDSGAATNSNDSFALSGTNVKSNFSQLMGAVGAATGATTSEPTVTVVDGKTTSSFDTKSNTNPSATVIAF